MFVILISLLGLTIGNSSSSIDKVAFKSETGSIPITYLAVVQEISKGNIYWYPNKTYNSSVSNSPMRFILSNEGLKWGWYLFLIGMIILMIFNAKRKQRIIPIIKPLTNTTVDFTKTIGNLYFQEGNHDTIMEKKIIYFLEKIRQDYLLDTPIKSGYDNHGKSILY